MLLWAIAVAAEPTPELDGFDEVDDVVCAALSGPPRGAAAIARSALGWAHTQRRAVYERRVPRPDPEPLQAWIPVSVPETDRELSLALRVAASPEPAERYDQQTWVVVAEARGKRRAPVIAPNLTVVVDVSESMQTVHTRRLPLLHRESGELMFGAIPRLEVARAALHDLIDRLPHQARVSVTAQDAFLAREVLPPTRASERQLLHDAVARLHLALVRPTDPQAVTLLEATAARTFDRCHDNRVLILTDRVEAIEQRKAMERIRKWAGDDVELWNFGIGVNEEVERELALLGQAAGGATWLMNTGSDATEIWTHLLDPGGVVATDVVLRMDFPAGSTWREIGPAGRSGSWPATYPLGAVVSGQPWSRVYEVTVPVGSEPADLALWAAWGSDGAAKVSPRPGPLTAFAHGEAALRTRAVAAWWAERPDDPQVLALRAVLPARGHGTELRAWMAHAEANRARGPVLP